MKHIPFGSCKHNNHSRTKTCCCGGHNSSNAKSNINHNSTRRKLMIQKTRKALSKLAA